MTEDEWQDIKRIFLSAIAIDPADRPAYLASACKDDRARAEVESLLNSHSKNQSFIEEPVFRSGDLIRSDMDRTDQRFGNYGIIREIGVGGMGAVFLARRTDGEFDHEVALKIVRQTIADSDLVERFKGERQILASLNHPNIAKLLDGGVSEGGDPFLAMEYVEGESIVDFATHQRLSLNEKLRLFIKVCSAVAYAHRNLVVHRDIKPGNILVTSEGEPKLLDFGLAKLISENVFDDVSQTKTAFRALTPAYASPEQLRGEPITTSSDVYSLGVVLYELLANEPPFHFEHKSLDQIMRTVTELDPPPPSVGTRSKGYNAKLHGDIDNIVLMSLRKEAGRRYQSVDAFAEDIGRYLKGLPVAARPNTFKYRAEKFIKRNRGAVVAATIILGLLITGIMAVLWEFRRAEIQRVRAEKRFGEVRKLSNSLMFEIHDSVQNLQGSTPTRQLIVSRALEYLDSLAEESAGDAGLQIELATAYQKVGDIQGNPYSANLGDTAGSLASYKKSISILENLKDSQTSGSQMRLGQGYRALGDILDVEGKTADCINSYRHSLDIFEKLAAGEPQNAEATDELARAYETLGDGLSRTEEGTAETLTNYQKTLMIRRDLGARHPDERKFQRSLGLAYLKVGMAMDPKEPEAAQNGERGITILESLSNTDPTNGRARREVGFAYYQLGIIYTAAGDYKMALETREKAFAIRREIAANDPQNKQAQFDLGAAYGDLSEGFANNGDYAEALANASKSQQILEALSKEDTANAIYRRNVALSYEKSAAAYAAAAQDERLPIAARIASWKNSRSWYDRTRQVFVDLKGLDQLQPRDAAQIDKYSDKISLCETAMSELGSRHSSK